MSAAFAASLSLATPDDTARLARALAPSLAAGDVLLLAGGIGAGKTHFARALIQERLSATGRVEDVPSPTYTLVQVYEADAVEIWHADLYRLHGGADLVELGLDEAMETAIVLIEWPDRMAERPAGALALRFLPEGEGRRVEAQSDDARWRAVWDRALSHV